MDGCDLSTILYTDFKFDFNPEAINRETLVVIIMEDSGKKTFLGLEEDKNGPHDIVLLPIPYEMTTSYREGTEFGPEACIDASLQIELFDELLDEELPCGYKFFTSKPWNNEVNSLTEALGSIEKFSSKWVNGKQFPIFLGGEHGMLLPIIRSLKKHPEINGDLEKLTILQIDAHADLRNELNGERFSHGTVIRRVLDEGVGKIIQVGIRTYCLEEKEIIETDERVNTWFARDLIRMDSEKSNWNEMINQIKNLSGPVWLSFDIDGLDGFLVPATGTPVPGGLSFWGANEIIQELFSANNTIVIGADINEISTSPNTNLTEFSAALITTKIIVNHISSQNNINQ
ncbi:MAG: agmatinase [Euryarchaeota archaeon]|nr:agmatinase [Euryarchaeota archaeon]